MFMSENYHDSEEALRLIKQTHANSGQPLSQKEILEFIRRPIYLGRIPPRSPPKGTKRPGSGRGRPNKPKNPYEAAYQSRRAMYAELVRNPGNSRVAAAAKKKKAATNDQTIRDLWISSREPRRTRASWIVNWLFRNGIVMDRQAVVRSLKRQNLWRSTRVPE